MKKVNLPSETAVQLSRCVFVEETHVLANDLGEEFVTDSLDLSVTSCIPANTAQVVAQKRQETDHDVEIGGPSDLIVRV